MADDIKKLLKEHNDDIKLHFDTVAEDLEKNIVGAMREELETNSERLDLIEKSTERVEAKLGKIDNRLASVETILESVNLPALRQKVITLEKRLDQLETKAK